MRILSWNCRGLGSPSTVPQLKESMRLFKPELVFLCETKRKRGFVNTISKTIGWGDRWEVVEPNGKSGGLLLGWGHEVHVHQIISNDFCMEVEFESCSSGGRIWAIFIYASNKEKIRHEQWQYLISRTGHWGHRWILGGDFNDIRNPDDKKGGRPRTEASCKGFRDLIDKLEMEEVSFQGRGSTWANNWNDEGYIEVRLDRFFGSAQWLVKHPTAIVKHIERQSSDHCLLLLDTKPEQQRRKSRFYFDKRWISRLGFEEVISNAWQSECEGSPMFQVAAKIKLCRLAILQWHRTQFSNAAKIIQDVKTEMEELRQQEEARDWTRWQELKQQLHEAYIAEEAYWS